MDVVYRGKEGYNERNEDLNPLSSRIRHEQVGVRTNSDKHLFG